MGCTLSLSCGPFHLCDGVAAAASGTLRRNKHTQKEFKKVTSMFLPSDFLIQFIEEQQNNHRLTYRTTRGKRSTETEEEEEEEEEDRNGLKCLLTVRNLMIKLFLCSGLIKEMKEFRNPCEI